MPALAKIEGVEIVAFCDIVEERAVRAAKDFGEAGSKVYLDYKKLLKDKAIDVVHVLTPNREHCEITVAALNADKHVMCEKPMAKSFADAKKMMAAYEKAHKRSGKLLTIGYQNRYSPETLYLKSVCEAGELGEIYYARAISVRRRAVPTWGVFLDEEAQGGGPLIDIGTHCLDLTLWAMNNYKPKNVVGNIYKKLNKIGNVGNAWGKWDESKFTVEDSAFGFVTMEDGATISLETAWAINVADPMEPKCLLAGTKGGADTIKSGVRINSSAHGRLHVLEPNLSGGGVAFYAGSSGGAPHEIEAATWINAIRKSKMPIVLPEQALVVTQILEGVYESAKTGTIHVFKK
jgi:predicted dehydrogenase